MRDARDRRQTTREQSRHPTVAFPAGRICRVAARASYVGGAGPRPIQTLSGRKLQFAELPTSNSQKVGTARLYAQYPHVHADVYGLRQTGGQSLERTVAPPCAVEARTLRQRR